MLLIQEFIVEDMETQIISSNKNKVDHTVSVYICKTKQIQSVLRNFVPLH